MTEIADRGRVSELLMEFPIDDAWIKALDPDSPEWLVTLVHGTIDAYESGDVDWLLAQTHPEVVITQPEMLPDARTYVGHEGWMEALLDWPNEWEDFTVEPTRIWAVGDDAYIVDGIHRGRSLRMDFEVEVRILWLFQYEDGLMRRWRMFTDLDETLAAAEAG